MSSAGNFPPNGYPWRPPSSARKPQQLAQLLNVMVNGGSPWFIRLPRLIKCSFEAAASFSSNADDTAFGDGSVADNPSPTSNSDVKSLDATYQASISVDHVASIIHGIDSIYPSSITAGSNPADATAIGDVLSATCISSAAAVADSQLKYDVFISFRGPDSRDNFVSHLYAGLQKKTETFIDSEKLEPGHDIAPALSDAIERSRISVVLFTKEYASSKWCMRELARIMECRRSRGQIVLPVFLGVEPMEVRWQTGSYDVAFSRHDKAPEGSQLAEEVKEWRKAMSEAANLSGFDSSAVRYLFGFLDDIVDLSWHIRFYHVTCYLR